MSLGQIFELDGKLPQIRILPWGETVCLQGGGLQEMNVVYFYREGSKQDINFLLYLKSKPASEVA